MSLVAHYLIALSVVSLALTAYYRGPEVGAWLTRLKSKGHKDVLLMIGKQEQVEGKGGLGGIPLSHKGGSGELESVPTTKPVKTEEQE